MQIAADLFPDWLEERRTQFYMDKEVRVAGWVGGVQLWGTRAWAWDPTSGGGATGHWVRGTSVGAGRSGGRVLGL